MRLVRRLAFAGILGAFGLPAVACSDDENAAPNPGDAGANDSSTSVNGTGGAKATGGRGGTGGRSGAGGTQSGGSSGTGGAVTGGRAGTGGASTGGAATGGAGTGGATGGTSGTGGAGGAREAGPPDAEAGSPAAKSCGYRCNTDADCLMGTDAAPDATYKCHPVRKRCENPITTCTVNDDCVAFASQWFPSCTTDLDCFFPGDVCVDAGGVGLCATPAPTDGGECMIPPARVTRPRFGGEGGAVEVCGDTSAKCDKNACILGCDSSTCTSQGHQGLTCNATSGLCECSGNAECGVGACNNQSHHCECVANGDCTVPGQDVCSAGSCGCSSATACPASPFRNATAVCE
jgi:hypothetical protein